MRGVFCGSGPVPYQLREGEPRKLNMPLVLVSGGSPKRAGSYQNAKVVVVVVDVAATEVEVVESLDGPLETMSTAVVEGEATGSGTSLGLKVSRIGKT